MIKRCVAILVPAFLGCGGGSESPPQSSADSTPTSATAVSRFAAPGGDYVLELPTRWAGHYRVDSLSTAERGKARHGVLVFSYLPSDSTIRPQVLAIVAVYDSASWAAVRSEGGPPPGDSVIARGGRVYVVAQPQSNPFPPQSSDAVLFGLMQLKPAEVTMMVLPR